MLMAIWQKGMETEETHALTKEMMHSGEVMSWPAEWEGLVVDKHSTGGVGDKVSLVLAPALAACGCKVPMISGRGLAHTGGTLDKLESIPGFNIYQPVQQLQRILAEVGCCIVGQTETLVPADKVLYALRDATSTVDSLPLITGSIISKKGAESLSALVLDVKFGRAALYKDLASAKTLAQSLVTVGNSLGMRTGAVLSRMDAPIGRCVGNSLEVIESLEILKGRGSHTLIDLVTTLGGLLLVMSSRSASLEEGKRAVARTLQDGSALAKFQAMMQAQGVANHVACSLCSAHTDYYSVLRRAQNQTELKTQRQGAHTRTYTRKHTHTQAQNQTELKTQRQGTVLDVDGMVLAEVLHSLGAGRSKAGEPINHSVGAELLVSLGEQVDKGQPWLCVHFESPALSPAQTLLLQNILTLGTPLPQHTHTHTLVEETILP
ncbi:thymidine phosphorylase isoform X3 [Osmerus mordax]